MSLVLCVMMVTSDLLAKPANLKEEWKSVLITLGGQCVMTVGMITMQTWCVLNLATHQQVRRNSVPLHGSSTMYVFHYQLDHFPNK